MLDVIFVGNFPQVTPQNMFDQGAHLTAVQSQIDALIIAIASLQEDYQVFMICLRSL